METTVHNPDRYMGDLRQILAQGRKRIGLLIGAGAPASIQYDRETQRISAKGEPLIPTINGLTKKVLDNLDTKDRKVIADISVELGSDPNIEMILSRVRSFAGIVGSISIHGCDGDAFNKLAGRICEAIGGVVNPSLPEERNPYTELAAWIGGTDRWHPIEIFTPNYDLLMEEAFERLEIPFFDGFSGSFQPFFDPSSISNDDLPPRWTRLWKLHGSLGWAENGAGGIIRGQGRTATNLIYPDHLKYDRIQKLPFIALFDRLRKFLTTPDTLLLTCGFSYFDAHISAVIDESLAANPAGSVFAFQYGNLNEEKSSCVLASKRPNMSIYSKDGAMINCIDAPWRLGELPNPDWEVIRGSFWGQRKADDGNGFLLGDFMAFARFFSLTHAEQVVVPEEKETKE